MSNFKKSEAYEKKDSVCGNVYGTRKICGVASV